MFETLAFGAKLLGGAFSARSAKKKANKDYELKVGRIQKQSKFMQEDLLNQSLALQSSIEATVGSTGARSSSAQFGAVKEDEAAKTAQRRFRIQEGEKDAIQQAAFERRSARDSANTGFFNTAVDAVVSADFEKMGGELKGLGQKLGRPEGGSFIYNKGQQGFRNSFGFESGSDFINQSPDYRNRFTGWSYQDSYQPFRFGQY